MRSHVLLSTAEEVAGLGFSQGLGCFSVKGLEGAGIAFYGSGLRVVRFYVVGRFKLQG